MSVFSYTIFAKSSTFAPDFKTCLYEKVLLGYIAALLCIY